MSLDDGMLAVIDAIYAASVDESRWPHALKELTDITSSQAASFWVLDGSERPRLPVFTYINFDPKAIQEYLDHTAALDPTVQYLVRHPDQPIVHDGLVITEREKELHPYYDWHDRHVETRFRMVGQVRPAPSVQAGVALHRTRQAGRYEPEDIERFSLLYRHLERALAIGFRLGSLAAARHITADFLDRHPAAILLLDQHRRVVYANQGAALLNSERDGIGFSSSGIAALRSQDNVILQQLIAGALSSISTPGACPGGVMRASRPSGKRPYVVVVSPVSTRLPALSSFRPAVSIVITDATAQKPLSACRLQALFGLTQAEARLAALLAAGEELRSSAAKLKITYGTARVRLNAIFQKTETRRQGELIRILLTTGPAG